MITTPLPSSANPSTLAQPRRCPPREVASWVAAHLKRSATTFEQHGVFCFRTRRGSLATAYGLLVQCPRLRGETCPSTCANGQQAQQDHSRASRFRANRLPGPGRR
eukprot:scaffold119047_cov37-Tisochrysis_lutea.AAC.3